MVGRHVISRLLLAVMVVSIVGVGTFTGPAAYADGPTVPGAPQSPSAVPYGASDVLVQWTSPESDGGSAITEYVVTPTQDGVPQAPVVVDASSLERLFAQAELTMGAEYTFTIAATNAVGTGPASAPTDALTPDWGLTEPTDLEAVAGDGQVTLTWTPPAHDGGSPITGYVVQVYLSGNQPYDGVVLEGQLTTTVLTLPNNVEFSFVIGAFTAVHSIGPYSEFAGPVIPVGGPPGAATRLVPAAGDAEVSLSWSAPVGPWVASGYRITPYRDGIAQPPFDSPSTDTTAVVPGLTNGVSYAFRVTAYNVAGDGPRSTTSSSVIVGAPGRPEGVSGVPSGSDVTLSWIEPASNGAAISGYLITSFVDGVAQNTVLTAPTIPQVVTGLTSGVTYTFRVAAVNARGEGVRSAASRGVLVGLPGRPTAVRATGANASAVVTWTAPTSPGPPITGYVVTVVGTPGPAPITFTSVATTQTVPGLTNGVSYQFRVAATSAGGVGPQSTVSSAVVVGAPGRPGTPSVAPLGSGSVQVSWSPPAPTAVPVTGYRVIPLLAPELSVDVGPTSTTAVVSGLTESVGYAFVVVALNGSVTGVASPISALVVPGAPGRVTGLRATAGNGSATLSWTAPPVTGNLYGYLVTVYADGNPLYFLFYATTSTTAVVPGLTNGVSYSFRVQAAGPLGYGTLSAPSKTVVPFA